MHKREQVKTSRPKARQSTSNQFESLILYQLECLPHEVKREKRVLQGQISTKKKMFQHPRNKWNVICKNKIIINQQAFSHTLEHLPIDFNLIWFHDFLNCSANIAKSCIYPRFLDKRTTFRHYESRTWFTIRSDIPHEKALFFLHTYIDIYIHDRNIIEHFQQCFTMPSTSLMIYPL